MRVIADLHIHSKYSRATSKDLSFENLVRNAKIKGINILGTGDFTHPKYFEEIKKLKEKDGIYYYKTFPFIITGEISLMYTQDKGRKVHIVILVPNIKIAEQINSFLDTLGRRDYDGRPIFNISCIEFTKKMMEISEDIELIPAHAWTPWFGIFGSKSGFNSLSEAFGDQIKNIHAIETGLSSDPEMNWILKELDNITIVSFSDSHSFWPWRLGREATILNIPTITYKNIIESIRNNTIEGTIEVDPAYGMYHYDGHRNCNFSCSPEETKKLQGICPVCKDPLTIGVDFRINELAEKDRNNNYKPKNAKAFYKVLPLHEIIALFTKSGIASKKNWEIYNELIQKFNNEFNILLNISKQEMLNEKISDNLVDLILKNREGKIKVKPGYDGVYGEAILEEQKKLF
ncbi:MAG TPA: endonuclease Q family protein [Candidatus Paceibacterota bacterium]|nr:endonuclease Q family protein [Candidatus Paceibacterota bacterium]